MNALESVDGLTREIARIKLEGATESDSIFLNFDDFIAGNTLAGC